MTPETTTVAARPSHNRTGLGSLVRLTPFQLAELPAHPSLPHSPTPHRPQLALFLRAILDEGVSFLSPTSFHSTFAHSTTKSSQPSAADVEVWKRDISASDIGDLPWSDSPVSRKRPDNIATEYWFVRRSKHENISSKQKAGTARWDEFVFGLRDEHSKHEADFTPTLYDARHVLDWNEEINKLETEGLLGNYTSISMSIFEMCHALPPPLKPRCFPVLVCTASTSPTSFLAVTVPVNLSDPVLLPAFYSSRRNSREGADVQQKKTPVLGIYAAVETVEMKDGEVEWIMATASDAKGSLPMWAQKMGIPGAVAKDVGFFMKWIQTVDDGRIPEHGQ